MERENMYELLAFILKSKKEMHSIAALDVIFDLIDGSRQKSGYCRVFISGIG